MKTAHHRYHSTGFIAITSVIVISVVILAVATSISLLGVGESQSALSFKKSYEVGAIAHGCLEEALLRLKDDAAYSTGSLNVGNGSCTINLEASGNIYTITIAALLSGPPQYSRTFEAVAKRTGGSLNLTAWREI